MKYVLSLAALLALAACNTAGTPSGNQASNPAPTGITSSRGGGAQTLGNTSVSDPISTTTTTPIR